MKNKIVFLFLILALIACDKILNSDEDDSSTLTVENQSSYTLGIVDFAKYTYTTGCETWRGANNSHISPGKSGKINIPVHNADISNAHSLCIKGYSVNYKNDNISWYSMDFIQAGTDGIIPKHIILTDQGWSK